MTDNVTTSRSRTAYAEAVEAAKALGTTIGFAPHLFQQTRSMTSMCITCRLTEWDGEANHLEDNEDPTLLVEASPMPTPADGAERLAQQQAGEVQSWEGEGGSVSEVAQADLEPIAADGNSSPLEADREEDGEDDPTEDYEPVTEEAK